MNVSLTVFFDEPFYVGVVERLADGRLSAAKVVFGAEPKDTQVYEWVLAHYHELRFSPGVEGETAFVPAANPKRRQRQAARAENREIGTKSQQALALAREENKQARKIVTKEQREKEAQYKLQLHIEKKKAKHRGH